ncbi:MAG TPA: MarR family winged helix-turn-helix transcriptional regulator [Acidimicrobiales bacterium]|nr:MarR family winged helix-turn-helix transcriptional regulator [Acidimicrobiales bacterium]
MHDAGTDAGDASEDRALSVEAVRALVRASRVLERSSDELSLAHYRVLSAIAAGAERASRVAERLELGKPTVSAAVDTLWRAGLIVRTEVEGDQRALALHLTAAGHLLLDRVEEEMAERVDDLCARTPDAAALKEALAWLGAAIDLRAAERARARQVGGG